MMGLPEFIKAAVGWFQTTDTKLDALAKSADENDLLRAQVVALQAENSGLVAKISAFEKATASASAEAAKAAGEMAAEIENLKAAIEAEKRLANDVIASQGLPSDAIPAASPRSSSSKAMSLTERCLAANRTKSS